MASIIVSAYTNDSTSSTGTLQTYNMMSSVYDMGFLCDLVHGVFNGEHEVAVWVTGFTSTDAARRVGEKLMEEYGQTAYLFLHDGVVTERGTEYVAALYGENARTFRIIETTEPPSSAQDHTFTMYGTYLYEIPEDKPHGNQTLQ